MLALDELRELIEERGPCSLLGLLKAQRVHSAFALDELMECLESLVDEKSPRGIFALEAIEQLSRLNVRSLPGTWTRHTIDLSLVRQHRKIQESSENGTPLSRLGMAAAKELFAPCAAALTHLVHRADGTTRKAATRSLGCFCGTVPILKELLLCEATRESAERALADIGTEEASEILLNRFAKEPSLHSLFCLSKIPNPKVLNKLEKVCLVGGKDVCTVIAANIGEWPFELAKTLLQELLRSEWPETVVAAIWSIQETTKDVLFAELPTLLNSDDCALTLALLDSIGRVGRKDHVPLLLTFLKSEDPRIRIVALDALVSLVPAKETFMEHVLPLTKDADVRLRLRALLALSPFVDSIDLQPLKVLVQKGEEDLRLYIARYLGYVQSPTALKLLEHFFRLNFVKVQVQILQSLWNYPREGRERILQLAHQSKDSSVQRALASVSSEEEGDEIDEVLHKWRLGACEEAIALIEELLSTENPSSKSFEVLNEMMRTARDCSNSPEGNPILWAELERRAKLASENI